jgi:hypothetical protein
MSTRAVGLLVASTESPRCAHPHIALESTHDPAINDAGAACSTLAEKLSKSDFMSVDPLRALDMLFASSFLTELCMAVM